MKKESDPFALLRQVMKPDMERDRARTAARQARSQILAESKKLFDLDRGAYPGERGDTFRTIQTFICPVCEALSNEVYMGGAMVVCPRIFCPNGAECWHHVLKRTYDQIQKWRFGFSENPDPHRRINALKTELRQMRERCLPKRRNDLVGNPDTSRLHGMSNLDGHRRGTFCLHQNIVGRLRGSWTEDDLKRSEMMIQKVMKLGPSEKFESLISDEEAPVRAHLHWEFYGDDADALLFPEDDVRLRRRSGSLEEMVDSWSVEARGKRVLENLLEENPDLANDSSEYHMTEDRADDPPNKI